MSGLSNEVMLKDCKRMKEKKKRTCIKGSKQLKINSLSQLLSFFPTEKLPCDYRWLLVSWQSGPFGLLVSLRELLQLGGANELLTGSESGNWHCEASGDHRCSGLQFPPRLRGRRCRCCLTWRPRRTTLGETARRSRDLTLYTAAWATHLCL